MKPDFVVTHQVRHNTGYTTAENGYRLEMSDLGCRGIVVIAQLFWAFVFVYTKSRVSHDGAQIIKCHIVYCESLCV